MFNSKRLFRLINLRNIIEISSRLESLFIKLLYTERLTRKLSLIKKRRLSLLFFIWEKTPKNECNSILKNIWRKSLCSYFWQLLYWYYNLKSLLHNYALCLERKTLNKILKTKLYNFNRLATLPDILLFFKYWEYSVIKKILNL